MIYSSLWQKCKNVVSLKPKRTLKWLFFKVVLIHIFLLITWMWSMLNCPVYPFILNTWMLCHFKSFLSFFTVWNVYIWKQIKSEAGLYLMFVLTNFQDYLYLAKEKHIDIFPICKESLLFWVDKHCQLWCRAVLSVPLLPARSFAVICVCLRHS